MQHPIGSLGSPPLIPDPIPPRHGSVSDQCPSGKLAAPKRAITRRLRAVSSDAAAAGSVKPVYISTPADRGLRTPHSGYHFDGSTRPFFEGWYFKVAIPEIRQSFCFMYTVENPAFRKMLSPLEVLENGPLYTGTGVQILGADDKYICRYSQESGSFWGNRHELMLGNTFLSKDNLPPPDAEVHPQEFNSRVSEGFQVTPHWNQGFIHGDDGRTDHNKTVKTARWEYSTRPVYGWGNVNSKQKATAWWLAAFPVFEPHWQICMASGLSTGWIEWDGEMFEFQNAPSYSEKNWGGAFLRKWFWIQCNVFEGARGEVSLTVVGALRQLPGPFDYYENAALIAVHYNGVFYEFVPWNGVVTWEVSVWGYWHMSAENETHIAELEGTTEESGTMLLAPTSEAGLAPTCKDACSGLLRLRIWEKGSNGIKGKNVLDVTSNMAALEVGGGPWFNTWSGQTTTPELLKRALRVPVDVEGFYNLAPLLKPLGCRVAEAVRQSF
uniref:Tocopherol cyclase n=1 Tax=Kalanchoe fedtschenkoi TaxID=63787 RepID=A0A7N0U7X6_KALFE